MVRSGCGSQAFTNTALCGMFCFMSEIEQPQDEVRHLPNDGVLEQVGALKLQSQEDRRAAIEADSLAVGALINQLAQNEAGLTIEHGSKAELVIQITDTLGRLGLNKMARGVAVSMRRVGGMY